MARQENIPIAGYVDLALWGREEGNEEAGKLFVFPFTRYANILNRPRVIHQNESIANTPMADFHIVVTGSEEMDDDDVFKIFRQTW